MEHLVSGTVAVFGHQVKTPVAVGLAAGGILAAVLVYRARKKAAGSSPGSSSTAPAAASPISIGGDPYPPDGTTGNPSDPYSTDPATGQTYGDESHGGGFANFGSFGNSGEFGTGSPAAGGFTSNAQWAQAAEQYITQNEQANPETVGNALGKYITGQVTSDSQQGVIEQAIAFEGYPPVNGPDGFPPSIRLHPPAHHHGPGHPDHDKPNRPPADLRAAVDGRSAELSWHKVTGATSYELDVRRERGGQTYRGRVHGERHRLNNLARHTQFVWTVAAVNDDGTGPAAPEHRFETR